MAILMSEKKQVWGFNVDYITDDGEPKNLGASFACPKMDTVYRYVQRKFSRIAKKVVNIEVFSRGVITPGTILDLIENPDGSISAHLQQNGHIVATEKPYTVLNPYPNYELENTDTIKTYQSLPPPPPKQVYPSLSAYPVFMKVHMPMTFHNYAGENKFKAKFYDVFPREK